MINSNPTFEQVKMAMEKADKSLPHDAYWCRVHEILDVPYGEVFVVLAGEQRPSSHQTPSFASKIEL